MLIYRTLPESLLFKLHDGLHDEFYAPEACRLRPNNHEVSGHGFESTVAAIGSRA